MNNAPETIALGVADVYHGTYSIDYPNGVEYIRADLAHPGINAELLEALELWMDADRELLHGGDTREARAALNNAARKSQALIERARKEAQ